MILGRVVGPVVSTVKHAELAAQTVLVVQPIEVDGSDAGASFLAVDHAQAGEGDTVLVLREGSGIRQVLDNPRSPVRCLIVAIVDEVTASDDDASQHGGVVASQGA